MLYHVSIFIERQKKTRATDLTSFIEILLRTAESECVGAFTYIFANVLFPRRAQEVDNNLQIYSRQICSRQWQARASWKALHRAVSYIL